MELKPNMYIRTKYDGILKIKNIKEEESFNEYYEMGKKYSYIEKKKFIYYRNDDIKIAINEVIKSSYNIIDLIKPKDIILGKDGKLYQCWKIYKDYVFTYSKNSQGQTITLVDYQIDKILTKEQFENMSYKVGD